MAFVMRSAYDISPHGFRGFLASGVPEVQDGRVLRATSGEMLSGGFSSWRWRAESNSGEDSSMK